MIYTNILPIETHVHQRDNYDHVTLPHMSLHWAAVRSSMRVRTGCEVRQHFIGNTLMKSI